MADPGFPRQEGGSRLLFGIIFAENCIEMKKIGLDPPMVSRRCLFSQFFILVVQSVHKNQELNYFIIYCRLKSWSSKVVVKGFI